VELHLSFNYQNMKRPKVLYVEDEPHLGRIVKESLEIRDFEVLMIDDGGLVIDAFKSMQPDMIVLDIMLPNVDGITLAKQIRDTDKKTPILFLTAKTQTKDVLNGFAIGGNDYLKKPFSLEELIARINNLISLSQKTSSAHEATATAISLGKYIFSPDVYELSLGNTKKSLSYRENELLKMLTEDLSKTVERKSILLKIWGDDSYYNSRTLDVYIKKLRDYLEGDTGVKILTIKGLGYRVMIDS